MVGKFFDICNGGGSCFELERALPVEIADPSGTSMGLPLTMIGHEQPFDGGANFPSEPIRTCR
jgi:hypothetical protein